MTDEQIMEMARQAWSDAGEGWVVDRWFDDRAKEFIAFAKLVAQHERASLRSYIYEIERELEVTQDKLNEYMVADYQRKKGEA